MIHMQQICFVVDLYMILVLCKGLQRVSDQFLLLNSSIFSTPVFWTPYQQAWKGSSEIAGMAYWCRTTTEGPVGELVGFDLMARLVN